MRRLVKGGRAAIGLKLGLTMRNTRLWTLLLLCSTLPAADKSRHVIVVSLDGFPAYALADPTLPLPVLRRLVAEGASAEAMIPVNPTVTWPNHTAMVTGVNAAQHGVIYNGLPVRPGEGKALRIEPWVPKTELVEAPTVYDAAHQAGLTTAEVDWVAIYHPPTIDWSFPELPSADGPVEREMLQAGAVTGDELRTWGKTNNTMHDDVWMRAAAYLIEKHRPNLLLVHLLLTDSVQHQYGARSLAGNTALILADRQLQRILDAVDRAGIRDQTTIMVVSDHGFATFHRLIHPNALLRQKGLLRSGQDCDGWVVAEGGTAMVYVTREERRKEVLAAFREPLEGVARTIAPEEYGKWGYPAPTHNGRMSDLVLAAAPDYAFDGAIQGEPVSAAATPGGAHGYLNTDSDMQAILVAWGDGIRHVRVPAKPNVDVAPTIARLLGVEFPKAAVLSEFLK
jgi:predicted AlkP superfamily pyrophosphatase or phosphodiesterase